LRIAPGWPYRLLTVARSILNFRLSNGLNSNNLNYSPPSSLNHHSLLRHSPSPFLFTSRSTIVTLGHPAAFAHGGAAIHNACLRCLIAVDQRRPSLGAGAASGWPSAMAPPLTLALGRDRRLLSSATRRTARKASLTSTGPNPRRSTIPASLQRAHGGLRGAPHDHGIAAHHGHVMARGQRLQVERFSSLFIVPPSRPRAPVADLAWLLPRFACRSPPITPPAHHTQQKKTSNSFDAADAVELTIRRGLPSSICGWSVMCRRAGDFQRTISVLEASCLRRRKSRLVAFVEYSSAFVPSLETARYSVQPLPAIHYIGVR